MAFLGKRRVEPPRGIHLKRKRRNGPSKRRNGSSARPELLKLGGGHLNVAKNLPERADFQITIAMHGNDCENRAAFKTVVASADTDNNKSLLLQETEHLFSRGPRKLSHGPTR